MYLFCCYYDLELDLASFYNLCMTNIYRKAALSDLEAIISLKDLVKKDIITSGLDIWQKDYPDHEILKGDITCGYGRIVCLNGTIISYMALIPTDIDYGRGFYHDYRLLSFSRIMTSPKYRNLGYGKMMISQAIEEAKSEYDGLGITVDNINLRAVSLYRSFGFYKVGSIRIKEAKNVLDKYVLLF